MGNEHIWTIYSPKLYNTFKALGCYPSGSIGLPQVLSHLKVFVNPLVTMFIIYNTLKCLLNVVYHVQQVAPIHGCCLPSTTIPPSLQTTTFKCCPFFLLLHIGCYLLMAINNLLLQKLPHGMPSYSLFYKKCKHYHGKGNIHCIFLNYYIPHTS